MYDCRFSRATSVSAVEFRVFGLSRNPIVFMIFRILHLLAFTISGFHRPNPVLAPVQVRRLTLGENMQKSCLNIKLFHSTSVSWLPIKVFRVGICIGRQFDAYWR